MFFLKQTLASNAFFLFLHHSRPSCCLFLWSNRRWGREKKSVKCFIWRSSNWLTGCRRIEIYLYLYIYKHRNKLCNWSRLFDYSFILCDCPKIQLFFPFISNLFFCRLISIRRIKEKICQEVYKHFNAFTHHITWWPVSIKGMTARAINGLCPLMNYIGIITPYCLLIDF